MTLTLSGHIGDGLAEGTRRTSGVFDDSGGQVLITMLGDRLKEIGESIDKRAGNSHVLRLITPFIEAYWHVG